MIQSYAKEKSANFDRNWNDYKEGFGSIEQKNFWIGLEQMHKLTASGMYGVQIDLKINDESVTTIIYDYFAVKDESDNYRLAISGFKPGTSGLPERLSYHNGRPFTTKDKDNDAHSDYNCATHFGNTGWWFGACFTVHLNHINGPTWFDSPLQPQLESKITLIKSMHEILIQDYYFNLCITC